MINWNNPKQKKKMFKDLKPLTFFVFLNSNGTRQLSLCLKLEEESQYLWFRDNGTLELLDNGGLLEVEEAKVDMNLNVTFNG